MWQLMMYCHWRLPDAVPLLTGHQRPTFDGFIYIHYAVPAYSARISAHLPASVWQSFVGFCLLASMCNAWQRSRMQNLWRVLENSICEASEWSRKQNLHRVGKMQVYFEAVCGPKYMSFWDDVPVGDYNYNYL